MGDVTKRVALVFFGPIYQALSPDSKDQIFHSKFQVDTRLEFESLEPLIDCLALLGQKLWPKKLNFEKSVKTMICPNQTNLCSTTTRHPMS